MLTIHVVSALPFLRRFSLTWRTEELNFHGQIDRSSPQFGTNYGYPECFAAWDPSIIPNNDGIEVGTQFAFGTGNDTECLERTPPKLCFPAHTAPLGVTFNQNGTAAYIAFHGSWYVSVIFL